MAENNYPIPYDFSGLFGQSEKRLEQLERRRGIKSAREILGPGYGPYAIYTDNFNRADCRFTGVFFTEAGTNTPDPSSALWLMRTTSTQNGHGVQHAFRVRPTDGGYAEYVRSFYPISGMTTYTQWEERTSGGGGSSDPHVFTAHRSSDLAIPSGAITGHGTAIVFNSVNTEVGLSQNGSGQIVIPPDGGGFYSIKWQVSWRGSSSGNRRSIILVNGSIVSSVVFNNPTTQILSMPQVFFEDPLEPGDVVTVNAVQSSGGDVSLIGGAGRFTQVSMRRINELSNL